MILIDLEWVSRDAGKREAILRFTVVPNDTKLKSAAREVCLRGVGCLIDTDSIKEYLQPKL